MTVTPIARPAALVPPLTGSRSPRLTDAGRLRDFVAASRTAVRFVALPDADRRRIIADLDLLEAEAERAVVRPGLVAGLRFAVETTIERAVQAG